MKKRSSIQKHTVSKEDIKEGKVKFLVVVDNIEESSVEFAGIFHFLYKNLQNYFHQKRHKIEHYLIMEDINRAYWPLIKANLSPVACFPFHYFIKS